MWADRDDAETASWPATCPGCQARAIRRPRDPDAAAGIDGEALRRARNCDGDTNHSLGWRWAPSRRLCPWRSLGPPIWALFDLWAEWRRYGDRVLPYPGDLRDQPGWLVEAYMLLDCEMVAAQRALEETQKDAERKAIEGLTG